MLKKITLVFMTALALIGLISIGIQINNKLKVNSININEKNTKVTATVGDIKSTLSINEIEELINKNQINKVIAHLRSGYIKLELLLVDGKTIDGGPIADSTFSHLQKLLIAKNITTSYQINNAEPDIIDPVNNSASGGGKSIFGEFFILIVAPLIVLVIALIGSQIFLEKYRLRKNSKKPVKTNLKISNIKFNDVAGISEAKDEVCEIVDFLKNPQKYSSLGGRIPRGIILYGEPGNGKTLLAKALAGEAGVPFFSAAASEFVELYVGLGASRIRDLFDSAKKAAPCVVFIDEIDSIGTKRGFDNNTEREQALNQLLTEMDGFDEKENVVVIAATNRIDMLDPALIRPGRFDRHIYIAKPTIKGREEIFQVYLNKIGEKLDKNVNAANLAKLTVGLTGAEIANLVNEAAILAAKKNKQQVEEDDFMQARDKIFLGLERKNLKMNAKELKTTAYHEIGHTLLAMELGGDPVEKVTIIPRAMALGVTLQVPEADKYSITEKDLLNRIIVLMGGRAAEELFIGEVTTGASHDLNSATKIAHQMITQFGMGKSMGLVANDFEALSSASQEKIEKEIQQLLEEQYQKAKTILLNKADLVKKMSEELINKETLSRNDLEILFK